MAHKCDPPSTAKKQKEVGTGQFHSCPSEDTTGPGQLARVQGALEAPWSRGARCGSHRGILRFSRLN